ncbi:hypothetical protein MMC27_001660 [Xylographa pallens]|nr:hypothetical protein [Xylographa pallens]
MARPQGIEIYATRLASFDIAQPTTKKKRASGAKGSLDGWEEEDDPVKEHLNYSPECGWAINIAIEQEVEEGIREDEDPMSAKMLEARKSTFGDRWPHKNKRGWTCKVQKVQIDISCKAGFTTDKQQMIEAGWYHCPTAESDDFVKCAYCNLSLDGWEPKDKPFEEHQRRSPECAFFTLSQSLNLKPTRAKQGRPSKISRMSTQSNATAALEDLSMLDAAAEEGDSIATATTNMTTASTTSKVGRQVGTAKIGKGKARIKAVKAAMAEDATQNSSFVEPEDDNFEVKVHTDSIEDFRGKKRPSSEMKDNNPPLEGAADTAKRRATRTRTSTVKPQIVPDHAHSFEAVIDTLMTDTKDLPPPTLPCSKKCGKPGRKRGSSTARKASNMSTASKAFLRGVPSDTEIDAALEADLNRPLTDDDAKKEACSALETRRLTRSCLESKQVSASIAPARETAQSSTITAEDYQVEIRVEIIKVSELDAALGTTDENLHSISTPLEEHSTTVKTKTRKAKGQAKVSITPKALEKQDILSMEQEHSTVHQPIATEVVPMVPGNNQANEADGDYGDETHEFSTKKRSAGPPKLKQLEPGQPSRQLTGRGKAESIVSIANASSESQLDMATSILTTKMLADKLLCKSDANSMTEDPLKPGRKKGKASKTGQTSKKVDPPSQQIENLSSSSMKRAEEDHYPVSPRIIDSETGEAAVGISVPLASATDFEERPRARESSAGQPNVAQEAEEVSNSKPGRGRPRGKAALSSSRLMQKQDKRTPEFQALPGLGPSTTAVGTVETFASSPRLTATFSPTLQPPTPNPFAPSPTPSPQSSDAENQPPSSRPSQQRPPLFETPPSRQQAERIQLAVSTPNTSLLRRNIASIAQTTFPWTTVDIENILLGSPTAVQPLPKISRAGLKDCLSSPEKKMTVEEWIQFNAKKGEEDLRNECERLVGRFEGEGNRALRALEGRIAIGY